MGEIPGGFLYEHGGFMAPFLVLGGILLAATLLSCFLIDSHDGEYFGPGVFTRLRWIKGGSRNYR